jgi:hypothetical protein
MELATKGLFCLILDGRCRLAQACWLWAGPGLWGMRLLEVLGEELQADGGAELQARASALVPLSPVEHQRLCETIKQREGWDHDDALSRNPMELASRLNEKLPALLQRANGLEDRHILRDLMQSNIASAALTDQAMAGNGLYCDWAYVLDLDERCLEVYRGGHHPNPVGRFSAMGPRPVQRVARWPLAALPDGAAFLQACGEADVEPLDPAPLVRPSYNKLGRDLRGGQEVGNA